MKVTDETLSAFLDAELPEQEMQAVRELLRAEPELTDRLAQLAMVDQQLLQHYSEIDQQPLPQSISDLFEQVEDEPVLSSAAAVEPGRVLPFRKPEQVTANPRRYSRMAIAAALVMAVGLFQWLGKDPDEQWQTVATKLETSASGAPQELADGRILTPRLTFENQEGDYCRQYRLQGVRQASENIACRTADGWSLIAEVPVEHTAASAGYQPASGGSVLDEQLDRMMVGSALTTSEERGLLDGGWSK